jgi:hypothetical protein
MRIGTIADQTVAVVDHQRSGIGMQIETDHDRHIRAERGTDAVDQLTFAVLVMLRHHRPVQIQIDRIERLTLVQPAQDDLGHVLERLDGDVGRRHAGAPGDRQQLMTQFLRFLNKTTGADIHPGENLQHILTLGQTGKTLGAQEIFPVRFDRGEGVGFMQKTGMCDTCHLLLLIDSLDGSFDYCLNGFSHCCTICCSTSSWLLKK